MSYLALLLASGFNAAVAYLAIRELARRGGWDR